MKANNKWIKDMIEETKKENPYPPDIFTEPTKAEWKKLNKVLLKAGIIQDKFFGAVSRMVWNNCCDKLVEILKNNSAEMLKDD